MTSLLQELQVRPRGRVGVGDATVFAAAGLLVREERREAVAEVPRVLFCGGGGVSQGSEWSQSPPLRTQPRTFRGDPFVDAVKGKDVRALDDVSEIVIPGNCARNGVTDGEDDERLVELLGPHDVEEEEGHVARQHVGLSAHGGNGSGTVRAKRVRRSRAVLASGSHLVKDAAASRSLFQQTGEEGKGWD